jgi:hypothetical protein
MIDKRAMMQELARELAMRRNVFPKWVASGKLKQEEADQRVNRMQAAYEFIDKAADATYEAPGF